MQFGWIFVMIVGALILLFFVSVIKTTGKSAEESKSADLKTSLNSMMSQSEVDIGTTRTIGMPPIVLSFDCQGFNIEGSSSRPQTYPYKTFFSPNTLKGREIITYSKYFEMPYKIDYFVYVTSKEIRYSFVNGSACTTPCKTLLSKMIKELPANMTYQIVDNIDDVKENNYYKERFILIGGALNPDPVSDSLKNTDVSAIRINSAGINSDYGNITYYKKREKSVSFDRTNETSYLGFPMLLGAIISEDSLYKCNVEKTMQKFKVMSTIYSNRTGYLEGYYSTFAPASNEFMRCYNYYNFSKGYLQETVNALYLDPFRNFDDISRSAKELKSTNQDYLMVWSCPLIY